MQSIQKILKKLLLLLLSCICLNLNTYAKDKKIIAITQIVEHPSLDQAKKGVIDYLASQGFVDGDNIEILDKNAQNSISNSALIAKRFVAISPDVIVAISTPSAQSAVKSVLNTEIPVVFSSVTDPVSSGLITKGKEGIKYKPSKNITGAIDYPLVKEELDLIRSLLPGAKKIGLLYNSGESNSVKSIDLIKSVAGEDISFVDSQVTNSTQIKQAFSNLIGRVDAIYIPSDNTVFSAMSTLVQLSMKHKIPVFSSDPDSVKQGVFACIGYSQYSVGQKAGELVVKILKGERYLPVSPPDEAEIFINKKSANIMNIKVPSTILGYEVQVIDTEMDSKK